MKKLFLLLLVFMLLGFGMGCDGDSTTNANSAVPNNQFNKTATIQGTVFDATTGARIGDSSLKITMVRGAGYFPPAVLYNTTTDATMLGDFVFSGVPVTLGGVATYRVVASMTGYETFEGYCNFSGSLVDTNNDDADTEDTVYNYIGNIYMFPLGQTAPDYTFYVEYDSERVSGATVYMEWKHPLSDETTNVIQAASGTHGLNATMVGTTDSAGTVTFASANLVLGGNYKITVLPMVFEGVQLARNEWGNVTVGVSVVANVISMSDLSPGSDDEGLFVTFASNSDQETLDAGGVLTITFNRAVTLVDETDCEVGLVNNITAALDLSDPPDTTVTVTGSGTTTLVLTPNLTTAIGEDDDGVYASYTIGVCGITVDDDIYSPTDIFSVPYADGIGTVSNRVPMTDWN